MMHAAELFAGREFRITRFVGVVVVVVVNMPQKEDATGRARFLLLAACLSL